MTTDNLYDDVKKHTTWAIIMGVLIAALGVLLIVYPMATATATSVFLGWSLIFVGLAQFVLALNSEGPGQFFLMILSSILFAVCGVALAFFPVSGAAALTVILGALLLAQSILQGIIAFKARPMEGWGWLLVNAIASLVLGIFILAKWPSSSTWAIGTLVGVSVFLTGVARVRVAAKIRSGASNVAQAIGGAARS